jgi:PAS domain S-box-containing protein
MKKHAEVAGTGRGKIGSSGNGFDADTFAQHLAAVVESSMHAILSKDLDGTIRTWNRGAERLYGYSRDEAVGRSVQMLVPGDRAEEWSHVMSRLARGETMEQLETERVRNDGQRIAVALMLSPIRDGSGKVVSASEIAHDITDRKRAEQALRSGHEDLAASLDLMARLQAVSTQLVQSGDSTSLLLEIVDAAIALTGADKGNIQLLEPSSGTLTIVASRGFERSFLEFFKRVHKGLAACGTALQTGKRVVIDDVSASPLFAGTPALDVLLSAGVRAVQTTPLVSRSGLLVGMLSTHYCTPHRLADRDLHVLDLLARQAADWIERTSAEKIMRESEERFRKIFENAATGIAITDWHGQFQQCNPAYSALLGYSDRELHEINFASLVHPEDREANLAELRCLQTGEVPSFEIENRYVHRDGQPIWVHKFVSVLPDETGKPAHLLALVTDITERKRAGAALRESEEKLRLFIEHAPVALAMFDRQMRYLAVSRRWLADYRLGDKKIIGRSHYEVFPEIPDRWREAYRRGLEGEIVRSSEDFFPGADGNNQYLRWEVRPWKQADDNIGGIVIFTEDITASKRAEEALVQSEERFRLMADHAPVMIWMSGTDKLCTWFNKPWLAFVGRTMRQELGYGWAEHAHPEDLDGCLQTYTAAFNAHEPFTMEYRLKRHDGEYRWILDYGVPVHSANREFTGYIGSCIDITERKRAEEALRQSEAHSRRLLDYHQAIMANMGEGLYTTDTQGLVTYMNPAAESLFGWKSVELLGRRMHDVTHYQYPDGRPFPIEECAGFQVLHEGTVLKDRDDVFIRRDGSFFPVVYSSAPLVTDGKIAGRVVVFRDVTERRQSEARLRESEARMKAILNCAADAIISMDIHGLIQSANPAAEKMFGYAAAEMIGRNARLLMPSPYEEEHDGFLERYFRTGEKHIIGVGRELEARRKDGSIFPIHLVVSEIEERQLFTGILRDMTEYKRLERGIVEAASERQQRIGQDLHDSVAQEITALKILASDLADCLRTDPADAAKLAERIEQGLQRSQQQIRAVLRGLLPVAVDGEGLMAALADLASHTQQRGKVKCTFDCNERIFLEDNLTATHLYLIAQEAVHNAVKHAKPQNIRIGLESKPTLVLRVQCDGLGMPASALATEGLGLRIMRNRAAIIGAQLTIEPATPTGTVVMCRLVKWNH